jgi:hypothetical protein
MERGTMIDEQEAAAVKAEEAREYEQLRREERAEEEAYKQSQSTSGRVHAAYESVKEKFKSTPREDTGPTRGGDEREFEESRREELQQEKEYYRQKAEEKVQYEQLRREEAREEAVYRKKQEQERVAQIYKEERLKAAQKAQVDHEARVRANARKVADIRANSVSSRIHNKVDEWKGMSNTDRLLSIGGAGVDALGKVREGVGNFSKKHHNKGGMMNGLGMNFTSSKTTTHHPIRMVRAGGKYELRRGNTIVGTYEKKTTAKEMMKKMRKDAPVHHAGSMDKNHFQSPDLGALSGLRGGFKPVDMSAITGLGVSGSKKGKKKTGWGNVDLGKMARM